jgi:hypothetical protein
LDAHASLYLLVPGRLPVSLPICLSQLALCKDDINAHPLRPTSYWLVLIYISDLEQYQCGEKFNDHLPPPHGPDQEHGALDYDDDDDSDDDDQHRNIELASCNILQGV